MNPLANAENSAYYNKILLAETELDPFFGFPMPNKLQKSMDFQCRINFRKVWTTQSKAYQIIFIT